eukprot:Gb_16402 [translate_table: standard]
MVPQRSLCTCPGVCWDILDPHGSSDKVVPTIVRSRNVKARAPLCPTIAARYDYDRIKARARSGLHFSCGKVGHDQFLVLALYGVPPFRQVPRSTRPPLPSHCSSYDVAMTTLGHTQPAGRKILRVSHPIFPHRGHLVHRYYQKLSCLRYLCPYKSVSEFWYAQAVSTAARSGNVKARAPLCPAAAARYDYDRIKAAVGHGQFLVLALYGVPPFRQVPRSTRPPLPSHCSSYDVAMTTLGHTQPAGRLALLFNKKDTTSLPSHIPSPRPPGSPVLPKTLMLTLLIQGGCAALKIIPSVADVAIKLLIWKAPTKMGNSPIELLVESYVSHMEHQHMEKGIEEWVHDLILVECYLQFPICSME